MQTVISRLHRTAGVLSVGTAFYYGTRYVEERIPFEKIDFALGISRSHEEREAWTAMNTSGAAMPADLDDVRKQNKSSVAAEIATALGDQNREFRVTKRRSSVANSGDGAHVSGKVARGAVVTFYHGPVYSPIVGRIKLLLRSTMSEYSMMLNDTYMIDGLTSGATAHGADGSSSKAGPLCNHCPEGTRPNAMFFPAVCDTDSLPAASADALRRISWYDTPPLTFDGARYQRTMVLVALRDVQDEVARSRPNRSHRIRRSASAAPPRPPSPPAPLKQAFASRPPSWQELFVDYRYDLNDESLPRWYVPVQRDGEPPRWEPPRPSFDWFIHACGGWLMALARSGSGPKRRAEAEAS